MRGMTRLCCMAYAAVTLSGCHSYVRTDLGSVSGGEDVRFLVTRAGASELTAATGDTEARARIEGTVDRREPNTIFLRVPQPPLRAEQLGGPRLDQMVGVPIGEILDAERRVIDRTRTGLTLGAGIVAATFIVLQIMDVIGDGSADDSDDDVDLFFSGVSIPIG